MSKSKAKLSQGKQYAYEEFMRRAEKEKRVRREEISMKALKPDTTLQARVDNINTEHVRNLHELLKNGQELAPIVVFEIAPGKLKIADGFHRHEVYRREKRPAIPCLVITGTLQEAVEYAASCNQVLSLPRKREDIKKAIYMLLENGWLERSAALIASQVGCSTNSAIKYTAMYCTERGVDRPDVIEGANGTRKTKRRKPGEDLTLHIKAQSKKGRPYFATNIGGKRVHLGTNERLAKEKLARMNADIQQSAVDLSKLVDSCARRGLGLFPVVSESDSSLIRCQGNRTATTAVSAWNDRQTAGILRAIAEALLISAHFGHPRKVVIKHLDAPDFASTIEVAGKLGVEFMTLDEFIASEKDVAQ